MNQDDPDTTRTDIVVLGAGMAGLTAARALLERGLQVCVLEARDRVGGRLLSLQTDGGVVELGAEFVHGRAAELWALIEESGAQTVERHGTMLRAQDGRLMHDDASDDTMFAPLEELKSREGEDRAFDNWIADRGLDDHAREALTAYVEGFNAADARRIGVWSLGAQQAAEDAIDGDRSWHVVGGYARLAEFLAARVVELGGALRLNCEVLGVHWQEGAVRVTTSMGDVSAARCLVALPLGVLQRVNRFGGIRMEPEPQTIAHARRMEMGHAARFTMSFRERWWQRASAVSDEKSLREMSFLFTPHKMPPVWWTAHPEEEVYPTLTGWVGGPRAAALEGKSAEALGAEACSLLAQTFGVDVQEVRNALVALYTHDWAADKFALGAYSYVPVGAMDAPAKMAEPEAGTMYFAGEHTDVTGHWGTVHAALRSGLRAASQIVD